MRGTYPPKTYLITHPWGYPQLFALPIVGHKHGQYRQKLLWEVMGENSTDLDFSKY